MSFLHSTVLFYPSDNAPGRWKPGGSLSRIWDCHVTAEAVDSYPADGKGRSGRPNSVFVVEHLYYRYRPVSMIRTTHALGLDCILLLGHGNRSSQQYNYHIHATRLVALVGRSINMMLYRRAWPTISACNTTNGWVIIDSSFAWYSGYHRIMAMVVMLTGN